MEYTVPAPCPHCGAEVRMAMEITDDGGAGGPYAIVSTWYQAVGIAEEQEFEEPHTCTLTDDDVNKMCDVATERAAQPFYQPAAYDD